jgi:acetyl-CoA carboxylase biotin carboxyl carrier protein
MTAPLGCDTFTADTISMGKRGGQMAAIQVKSELTARVWKIEVATGKVVAAGDSLMILESMKMEIPVLAPAAGKVLRLMVGEADPVSEGQLLAVIEA